MELTMKHRYSPIPSTYSSDLVEVVDNCLSRDYKKRYSTTMLLAKPSNPMITTNVDTYVIFS